MLRSPLLKYVAGPQTFAYMPPLLGGVAIGSGMMLWFMGVAIGFGAIPGILVGIIGCGISIYYGFKDPHIHNILLARQKFMSATPGLIKSKGKTYVG